MNKKDLNFVNKTKFLITALLMSFLSTFALAQQLSQGEMQKSFREDAGKYFTSVSLFYSLYKPEFAKDTGNLDTRAIFQAQVDFGELEWLCKTKYRGIMNPTDPQKSKDISERFGDWCEIAAQRNELLRAALDGAKKNVSGEIVRDWKIAIEKALNDSNDVVWDDVQAMLFEPAKWKAKEMVKLQRRAAENGGTVRPDVFDSINGHLQQLKSKIENDSKTNKWEAPSHSDAAIESFAKTKYLAAFKGIVIVKSGMDYARWKVFKNGLGIPTEQLKQGWILVKMPNQQGLCQARQFSVKKTYMGGGTYSAMKLNGYSEAGIYMMCN